MPQLMRFVRSKKSGRVFPYRDKFANNRDLEFYSPNEAEIRANGIKLPKGVKVVSREPIPETEQQTTYMIDEDDRSPDAKASVDAAEVPSDTPIGEMHWTQLRKLVIAEGGAYFNRDKGIEFLREKGFD